MTTGWADEVDWDEEDDELDDGEWDDRFWRDSDAYAMRSCFIWSVLIAATVVGLAVVIYLGARALVGMVRSYGLL